MFICRSAAPGATVRRHSSISQLSHLLPAAMQFVPARPKKKPTKNINQLSKLREKLAALREGDRKAALRKAHSVFMLSLHSDVKQQHAGCPSAGPAEPLQWQVRQYSCCQLTLQRLHVLTYSNSCAGRRS